MPRTVIGSIVGLGVAALLGIAAKLLEFKDRNKKPLHPMYRSNDEIVSGTNGGKVTWKR